jgi:anaerobic selenocysteine-containing dehydrogenase
MPEEMISRRDFLAGIGATLGLAAVAAIAVAPVTASASSAKAARTSGRCGVLEVPCERSV